MRHYQLKSLATQRIKQGERLVGRLDLVEEPALSSLPEGEVVGLVDSNDEWVAALLIGIQNKGIGWVLTTDPTPFRLSDYIQQVLQAAIASRDELFAQSQTNAYRLFNGEGDGLGGLTIDWYNGYLQINWYTYGLYQYREFIRQQLIDALPQLIGIYETIRFKDSDQSAKEATELTYGTHAPRPHLIRENDINFAVSLGDEWMTGIFLDQRSVRQFVYEQAQGLSVLNLFSYTGAFSVAAAKGGASQTISVDVANRSLDKTKEQFAVNDLPTDPPTTQIRVMDVFDYIDYAKRHELQFDWIICDPPSFARTKDFQFSADQDYPALAQQLFDLTAPGGMCLLSTNHSGYLAEDFQQEMVELGQAHPGQFQLIASYGLPEDFPTTKDPASQYLKVLIFYRMNA